MRVHGYLGLSPEQISKIVETEKMGEQGATFYGQTFDPAVREKLDRVRQGLSSSGFRLSDDASIIQSDGVYYLGLPK